MASTWPPSRESELLSWLANYSSRITANAVALGFTTAEATALANLVTAFQTAYTAAINPSTRTKTTVEAKDLAKAQVVATARSYARRIQANPAITPTQKIDLGLPNRSTARVPVPPPSTKPVLTLNKSNDREHVIRIADSADINARRKPAGVSGAQIFSWVQETTGAVPPTDLEDWRFEGTARRNEFAVDYRTSDVGKNAYIAARWVNPRDESGPVSTYLVAAVYGPAVGGVETSAEITPSAPKLAA